VARAHRGDGVVFRHLAAAFLGLVLQHGSQGIGGFQVDSRSRVTEMFKAMGGSADPGVRVWGNIKTPPPLVRAYMERLLSHVDGAF
jgi:hypothetical protein